LEGHRDDPLASISSRLRLEEPIPRLPSETAAVAVILAGDERDRRVLLIRRPERVDDPWSGHIALPGGRVQKEDGSFRRTAVRETQEEVGVDLELARFLGHLGRFRARTGSIWVVPCVFVYDGIPAVNASPEVASYRWVSMSDVVDETHRSEYTPGEGSRGFPSFVIEDYVVWGLTERILSALTGQ
jgi:8-oxo-dGTP diphosphatase